jgi:hypothetical protein
VKTAAINPFDQGDTHCLLRFGWCVLLLFSVAFAQTPDTNADISIDARTPLLETPAGNTVNVVFLVNNRSDSKQVVDLAAQLPQGWRLLFALEPVTLAPQSDSVVIVTVQIPEDAVAAAYLLTLTANAGTNPVTAEVTVLLPEIRRLDFQPLTVPDVVIADDVVLEYRLTNSGNIARALTLAASSDPDYAVAVTPQQVALEPNQSVPVTITVNVPELSSNVALQVRLQVREAEEIVTGQAARVTLLPESLPSRSGFHFLPVTARVEQTLDNRQRFISPAISLEGRGNVRDDSEGMLEFRLAAPLAPVPDSLSSNLGRYDTFAAYETPIWRVALGRQTLPREALLPLRGVTTGIGGGYTLVQVTETDTTETNTTETNTVNRLRDVTFDGYLLGEQGRAGRERVGVSITGRDVREPDSVMARATLLAPLTDNADVPSAAVAANITTSRRFPIDLLGDITFTGELGSAYDFAEDVAWQGDVTLRSDRLTVNAAHFVSPSGFRAEPAGRVNTRVSGNSNFQLGVRWFVSGGWQASYSTGDNPSTNRPSTNRPSTNRSVSVNVRTILAGLRPALSYFGQHSKSDRFDSTLTRFRVDVSQPLHLPASWGIDRTTLEHQVNWQQRRQGGREDEVQYTLDSRVVALGHTFGSGLDLALEPRVQLTSLGVMWQGDVLGVNGDIELAYLPQRRHFLALTGDVDIAAPWLAEQGVLELRTRLSSDTKRVFGRFTLAYDMPLELPLGRSSTAGSLLVRLQTPAGAPLANVVVNVAGLSLATDAAGEAFFPAIDGGSYQLDVRRADLRPGQLALPALPYSLTITPQEDQTLTITITDAGRVSGQIRLAEATGATFVGGLDPDVEAGLVGGVLVQLRQGERATRKLSNLDGSFLFEGIAPGDYVLEAFPNLPDVYVLDSASVPVTVAPNDISQATFTIERIQREIQFQDGGSLGGDDESDDDSGEGGITLGD